jgi:4-amino-4-deoxy-L-arabinose transferase-like glycosyltransferase
MNKILASLFYNIEVGEGRPLVRFIPLFIVVAGIVGVYNFKIYKGLGDQQSMDNAQLARQIVRHQPFTTFFIRPFALTQVGAYKARHGQAELFPESTYPAGTVRAIPDTYNSPGYPFVLAGFFKLLNPDFDEANETTGKNHVFAGDQWLPLTNHLFIILTAAVMFIMAYRLFDERVAWMSACVFLFSDFVWKFSLQATPVDLLFLLMALLFWGLTELYRIAEDPFAHEPLPFARAWLIMPAVAVLFGVTCLFCLPLLVLLLPVLIYLGLLQRRNWFFLPIFLIVVGLMTAPWFYHWYRACGNPLGSNFAWGLYGQAGYEGNQIFCHTAIPSYDSLFGASLSKEYAGFLWYFQRGWDLLGSNPLILLFAASILHQFRRRRVQAFRWLVVGSAFAIVAMTNLADAHPDPLGPWNLVVVLLPAMILVGTAFFFTLLDRLITQLPLFTVVIVIGTLALCIAPMLLVFTSFSNSYYNYPPYLPPLISYAGRGNAPENWIASDMPWATAWYGDHASLWLPETPADFTQINDNTNELSMILFTPITMGEPVTNLTSGEMKAWLPYALALAAPPETFPLHSFGKLPADYLIISNRQTSGGTSQ